MKPGLHAQIVWGSVPEDRGRIPGDFGDQLTPRAENRKERRYTVKQAAQILSPGIPGSAWEAQIMDISGRGMQLTVDEPVAAGPKITIRWNGRDINGMIRYNHRCDGAQYRIGVELCVPSESLMIEMLASQFEQLQQSAAAIETLGRMLQQYANLLDLASDALIVTSIDGTVMCWNKGAEQLYGWTKEETAGRKVSELFESEMAAGQTAAEGELRHSRKDGSEVAVKSCSIVQPDSAGRPSAILMVNRAVAV